MTLGDLLAGEDRHAVVRFGFMTQLEHTGHLLRARLVWVGVDGQPASSLWQELFFEYADPALERAHTLAGRHDKQLVQSGPLVAIRCRREPLPETLDGSVADTRDQPLQCGDTRQEHFTFD